MQQQKINAMMVVEIITPTNTIFSGTVQRIKLPGSKGEFEMLHNHAPIISTLHAGKIVLFDEHGTKHAFDVSDGVVEQAQNKVIVLVD